MLAAGNPAPDPSVVLGNAMNTSEHGETEVERAIAGFPLTNGPLVTVMQIVGLHRQRARGGLSWTCTYYKM